MKPQTNAYPAQTRRISASRGIVIGALVGALLLALVGPDLNAFVRGSLGLPQPGHGSLHRLSPFGALIAAAAGPAALNFDAPNAFIEVLDSPGLSVPVNFTFETRVKATQVAGYQALIKKGGYELGIEPLGAGFRAVYKLSVASAQTLVSGEIALSQWVHIAASYDGSNMRLFVNGSRVAAVQTSGNIVAAAEPLRFGAQAVGGDVFNGTLDEIRISNVIRYINFFVVPQAPFAPDANTVALWHMDEGVGAVAIDSSPNGNNGALQNGAAWTTDSAFSGPDITPPLLTAIAAGNISSTGATITWASDEAATSQVEYGLTTAYGASTALDAALVTNHAQTLSGLTPNTIYNFRVISRDATGNTATSANVTFATLANDPPAPPVVTQVSAGNISPTSVTISWVTDVPADSQVEFGPTTAYGSQTVLDANAVTAHAVNITGLSPSTTYHYRVNSRGQNGALATSSDALFTTSASSAEATTGQWSSPINWPLVAVHMALLPNGKVLVWDAWETNVTTSARVWDPLSQTFTGVTNQFSAIFCAGQAMLADGRQFVMGGFVTAGTGIKDADIFNPTTNSWTRVPDMSQARWYPTATTLGDGRVVVLGGDLAPGITADKPEVFDPVHLNWTTLSNAPLNMGEYPNAYLLPSGKVFVVAALDGRSKTLDVATSSWSNHGIAPVTTGTSAMYRPGKVIAVGGANNDLGSATAVIDVNQANPTWRSVAPMANARFQHNLVLMPDGKVFVGGGANTYSLVSATGIKTAEIWNPDTETWASVAAMNTLRMYHSTMMLLPDGRILSAGGGRSAPAVDYLNAEIYSPPYLFKGPRPTISSAPASLGYGNAFSVQTPDAANIQTMSLVRLSSVTHGLNMDQRYVPLTFSLNGNALDTQVPASPNTVPPGYYMLFIVNSSGIPSVSRIVQIGGTVQSDTQAPTVSISAPSNGASVAGNAVAMLAAASDNVGVTSVQFFLDGAPIGPALTSPPYTFNWDSTQIVNGSHALTAQARDAVGNIGTATGASIIVANASGDVTPPVLSGIDTTQVLTSQTTVVWTTNEAATSVVEYGLTAAYGSQSTDNALRTAHSLVLSNLQPNTTYHYRVRSTDAAGNTATSADATFTTWPVGPVVLFGSQSVGPNADALTAGVAQAFQYVANYDGTISEVNVYVDAGTTATQLAVGLFATTRDDNPGDLLAQAALANPVSGAWNKVAIGPVGVNQSSKYWIGVLAPVGGGGVVVRDVASGGQKSQTSLQANLSIMPSNWSVGLASFKSPLSAYVVQQPTAPPIVNALQNGDLEQGTLNAWSADASMSVVAAAAHAGGFGVKMTNDGRINQVFDTTPGTTYTVSAYIRLDQQVVAPGFCGLRVQVTAFTWQSLGTSTCLNTVNSALGQWTQVSFSFVATTAQSRVTFQNFSGGGQFVASADDFVVTTNTGNLSPTPTPVPTQTATPTATATAPATPAATATATQTPTPTYTPSPQPTAAGTATSTPVPPTPTTTNIYLPLILHPPTSLR